MSAVGSQRRVLHDPASYGVLIAIAVGFALAQWGPVIALAALSAIAVILAMSHERALLMVMTACLFVESLSVGGEARVGRVIGGLALFVIVIVVATRGWDGLAMNGLALAAGAMGFWLLLSVLWAAEDAYVYRMFVSFALGVTYMIAFALFVRRHRDIVAVFSVLAGGLLLFGFVAAIGALRAHGEYRAGGLQGNADYFALYQLAALAPALALGTYLPRPYRILGCIAFPIATIVSVGVSLSRAAFIILAVLLIAIPFLPRPNFFISHSERLIYILAVTVTTLTVVVVLQSTVIGRAQSILTATSHQGDKGAGRLDLWAAAWRGYKENPLLGLGAGNYQPRSLDLLQTTPGVNVQAVYVAPDRVVHNAYLEMLTDLGIPGLSSYILLLLLTSIYLIRARRSAIGAADLQLARASLALLVTLAIMAAFGLFASIELNKPTWIVIGFALAFDVIARRLRTATPIVSV